MSKKIISEECRSRIKLAEEIASKCLMEYGKEIIITGSVSRDLADEDSDIEIEFLVDNLMSECDMVNWIKEIGGTEIHPYGAPIGDGSVWIIFKYKEYWIEAGWQKIDTMRDNIKVILTGEVYTHDKLTLASTFKNAIFIRKNGILDSLQEELYSYPDDLQQKIIMNTISPWTIDLGLNVRRVLAKREDKIPLLERMIADIHRVLRILYALNKQWEPDWKWTKHIVKDLDIKPENLIDRINSIICIKDCEESLKACFKLIYDTLSLIPEDVEYNTVRKIMNNINR
ncbi:DUF4037 domain-containing protein [Clostridium aciditolerans]|uniref:DUF4037 domain-containing protein n=1 Tax=Clostridium aciditolerans TaxID=339861 RepID=A0A934HUE8_9CLOT|nr:DUF4037 domain-containing protein [Clostridium aciditolerans]MBI6872119.1 DUF4037 domain-containing protein [Clostridium aciditolerans]